QDTVAISTCPAQSIRIGRFRREKTVGILHDVIDPAVDDLFRQGAGRQAVGRDPVEAPLERPHHPVLRHGRQLPLPRMEEGLKHSPPMLYSAVDVYVRDTKAAWA